jgi:nicotinamidase-related amidase
MSMALLVIDMQMHFLEANRQAFSCKILPNLQIALFAARQKGIPVVHAITKYKDDKSDWPVAFRNQDTIWCLEDNHESDVIPGCEPRENETVIIKKRFTAFYGTNLSSIFQAQGTDTLFICGYSADGCVRFTTMDAYNEGFKIYWLTECMDSAWEPFQASLSYMKRLTHLIEITNDDFIKIIS